MESQNTFTYLAREAFRRYLRRFPWQDGTMFLPASPRKITTL